MLREDENKSFDDLFVIEKDNNKLVLKINKGNVK